jgi:hypothetical protein
MSRLVFLLAPVPALAVDLDAGVDVDLAFAYGNTLKAPGGGLSLHVGLGPNPLKLGPTALALTGEVMGSFWRFPDVEEGPTDLLRLTTGARGIVRLLWLRLPKDEGGRGRGIRFDLPIRAHVGVGSLDGGASWTPTALANVGLAIGLMPVEIGVHVGAGALAGSDAWSTTGLTGLGNVGVDVSIVF